MSRGIIVGVVTFTEHVPSDSIRTYVRELCGAEFDDPSLGSSLILPEATGTILVGLSRSGRLELEVKGPRATATELRRSDLSWSFGARFHQGRLGVLIDVPLSELTDHEVPLAEFWGGDAAELGDRLCAAASMTERLHIMERALARRVPPERRASFADAGMRLLQSDPTISVETLAERLGISARQLRRHFLHTVGLTPKEYMGLLRFRRAVAAMAAPRHVSWPQVATSSGYYDQAHMIADFRKRTSRTPTELLPAVLDTLD